jgi:hypothetical protein
VQIGEATLASPHCPEDSFSKPFFNRRIGLSGVWNATGYFGHYKAAESLIAGIRLGKRGYRKASRSMPPPRRIVGRQQIGKFDAA